MKIKISIHSDDPDAVVCALTRAIQIVALRNNDLEDEAFELFHGTCGACGAVHGSWHGKMNGIQKFTIEVDRELAELDAEQLADAEWDTEPPPPAEES